MQLLDEIRRPSKHEQKIAYASLSALSLDKEPIFSDKAKIEIEENKNKVEIPISALRLLGDILKAMNQGKMVSIVPVETVITTQKAAEILGCSRPYLVKLLEEGKIAFTKIGKHRRILLEDILNYKQLMKEEQKKNLIAIMNFDEEIGLYDSN